MAVNAWKDLAVVLSVAVVQRSLSILQPGTVTTLSTQELPTESRDAKCCAGEDVVAPMGDR